MPTTRYQRAAAKALSTGVRAIERVSSRRLADIPPPPDDPFYVQTEGLAAHPPGTVLDWREVRVTAFGRAVKADAWQVRYRSTDTVGAAFAAVATVLVPHRRASEVRRPLLSYQCAIDSLGPRADPSYTLRRGNQKELSLINFALRRGWAVVTADYTGPRHGYGAGLIAGRAVLDGIRAALDLEPAGLGAGTPVGLWGYSGGGQASTWAAEQHPEYAPELNIAMVAAGGVPADINAAAAAIDGGLFSGLALGASLGVSREFAEFDLDAILNQEGREAARQATAMTVDELFAHFPFRRMAEFTDVDDPLSLPMVREVLAKNNLGVATPTAPMYLYHSVFDQLCPIGPVDLLVGCYRAAGADVRYRRSIVGEHCVYALAGVRGALRALASGFATTPAVTYPVEVPALAAR